MDQGNTKGDWALVPLDSSSKSGYDEQDIFPPGTILLNI